LERARLLAPLKIGWLEEPLCQLTRTHCRRRGRSHALGFRRIN
jgi:hypothetical protein